VTAILHDFLYSSKNIATVVSGIPTTETSSGNNSVLGIVALVLAAFGFSLVAISRLRKRRRQPRVRTNQEQNIEIYFDRIGTGQDTNGEFGIQPDAYFDDSNPKRKRY